MIAREVESNPGELAADEVMEEQAEARHGEIIHIQPGEAEGESHFIEIPPAISEVPLPPDPMPVMDPTIMGGRRRKASHQRLYRWTQYCSLMAAGLAAVSVICTRVDEPVIGRWVAAGGVGVGIVAWILSGRSSLSARWRGWAAAATVFAVAAMGLTWIHENVIGHDPGDTPPSIRKVK